MNLPASPITCVHSFSSVTASKQKAHGQNAPACLFSNGCRYCVSERGRALL